MENSKYNNKSKELLSTVQFNKLDYDPIWKIQRHNIKEVV